MLLRKILFCFGLCISLWLAGLGVFVKQIPTSPNANDAPADAIVALTGANGRLDYGVQLLAEGKGGKLFITGVHEKLTPEGLLRHYAQTMRKPIPLYLQSKIVLDHQAENTIGNAEAASQWIKKENYKTIRLVTSNYHMPRSLQEFEEYNPDVTFIPSPSFSEDFTLQRWLTDVYSRKLLLSEYHKFLASKLRHWIITLLHYRKQAA